MELRKEAVVILGMSMSQGGKTLSRQLLDETIKMHTMPL